MEELDQTGMPNSGTVRETSNAGKFHPDRAAIVNTGRFYSQIRNFVIDITRTDPNAYVCAIHYQVAQATSLQDVELVAKTGTTQQGMCKLRYPPKPRILFITKFYRTIG